MGHDGNDNETVIVQLPRKYKNALKKFTKQLFSNLQGKIARITIFTKQLLFNLQKKIKSQNVDHTVIVSLARTDKKSLKYRGNSYFSLQGKIKTH